MKGKKKADAAPAVTVTQPPVENPLLETVQEKDYAQPNIAVDPSKLQQDIPEPQFTPPNIDDEKDIFQEEEEAPGESQPKGAGGTGPSKPEFNKTLNELSPKDQERSAEHAAAIIFAGYQKLHDAGNWWISISDDQVIKLQMDGEIDTSVLVPYTAEDWMPLMEFIQNYNSQAKGILVIDPEWRATVEPVLIRVLKKYKVGMTDEQFLIAKFGEDIAMKGIRAHMMRKTSKEILLFAKEQTAEARQHQQQHQAPLTAMPGGQANQQEPAYNNEAQAPFTAVPGGQAMQQGPMGTQDHVMEELRTQGNPGVTMTGVERSEVPIFGDKRQLKNLKRVSKKAAARKTKAARVNKAKK